MPSLLRYPNDFFASFVASLLLVGQFLASVYSINFKHLVRKELGCIVGPKRLLTHFLILKAS